MKKKPGTIIKALLAIMVLVALDQITKLLAVKYLAGQRPLAIIDGVLELTYLENQGAAFSILQNKQYFFWILTVIVILGLIWLFMFRIPEEKKYLPLDLLAVALIAGAAGNLIDRISQKYVVDFIYFKLIDFPVFNVADCYITVSCFVFFFLIAFYYKDEDLKGII